MTFLTVEITDTGIEGEGIGKTDGFILFVKDAVIGDTVQVKVMKAKKNYAYAKLEKVLVPSPFVFSPLPLPPPMRRLPASSRLP